MPKVAILPATQAQLFMQLCARVDLVWKGSQYSSVNSMIIEIKMKVSVFYILFDQRNRTDWYLSVKIILCARVSIKSVVSTNITFIVARKEGNKRVVSTVSRKIG